MSTPAVILLYDGSGKLAARYFHHWDGYPEHRCAGIFTIEKLK